MLTSIMAAVASVLPELAKAASGMMQKTIPVGINKAKQMHPCLLFQKIRMHLFLFKESRNLSPLAMDVCPELEN